MTTDNRTNEPTEAQIEAAGVAFNTFERNYLDLTPLEKHHSRIRAALVAAAGATPVVQQVSVSELAELIAKANYDWSQQRLEFWRRPASVESPGDLDQYIARAVVEAIGGESR